MSDSSASFQYDPNSAPPWAAPATFEELLFAFEAYQEINNRCRFSYLLHLLQLDLPSIALAEKITPDDAADRIAEAEKTLTEHVEACAKEYFLFQDDPGYKRSHLTPNAEEMLRRIFRLIEPDDLDAYAKLVKSGVKTQKNKRTDTVRLILRERVFHLTLQLLAIRENVQKPLDSLFPVLERVWRIYGMYAAEQKKTRNESVKYLPQPTRSELIEAKKVLFAMPKRLRTTFGLCDCAGLGIAEIVRELRVPPEKVEAWITQSHEFLARYTENLILEMLRHRELGIKTQLPLSALRTATFIWNTLPENFRNAYLRIVSDEHDTTLQENPELLEEIHHFITIQMGMMIMVLIRLASHGSPPPHYVRHLTRKRKNLKIKRPPSRMPISDTLGFALEIMNREHRETLQHSYGLKKIVSEIADMQHVPEEIVMERFDEARDIYDARVDYILCKMLIHDGDGKGPRLRQNEKRFAKRIFAEVPYNCREVTEEFLTTRASEEEIAEELDMPLHAVQDQLHRGLEVVRQNSLELLRDYLENEAKNQNEIDTIRHPRAEPALDWIGGGEPDEDDDDFDNKYTQEELSIAAKTITSFDLNEQAVAAVFYGQLLEPKQIGPALGIPMNEAYPLYDTIRKKLHERTLRLADAIILGDESVQGHEKNAVQNVLNTMDEFNRDVYERKARGATFEQIGKTFGIPAIEAEVRYESAQFVINSWTEMLASTWLRQKVDGTTNTDRILHKYRENRAETRRTDPDQAAAKEAFAALDATSQELFIRYFLHDTEDDADEKVEEICDFLKRHLVSHILKDDETGRRTLLDLPETAGKMFRRVEIQSESIADVAESMNVAPETVQAGLESAEYIINLRMKTLVLQWLTTEENGESNADRISRELHEKATVKSASTKLAVDHVQEPAALETASPKKWSFAASLFGGVGCSNAAPVIPFTTWLPMICVVPFLWFISLYITGAASGTVVILSAKTLQARQWLVKQLFQIYTILFTGSLVIITIIKVIDTCINLSFDQIIILIAIGVVLFFVLIVSLVLHIRKANKKWVNEPENIHFTPMQFVQLTRFIKFCFCASGAMLLGITIFTTFDTIIPLYQERIPFLSSVLGWLMVWAIFISSCFLFDYYLKISQDGTAFKITPPYDAKEDVKFNELIRISLFALFPIITGIGHICYNNYRPILTFMEMCFCTVCWTAIWYWNVQSTKRRYVRIIGTFIALIVATRILRHIIYPMFF